MNVTLSRGGGFAGSVAVSVDGLPAGVTVSVNPTALTGATTSAVVTVNVATSATPGTYTATIRASSAGVGEATATYSLTVTAIPNYALSATPASVSVPKGVSGTTTVNIARTNFTGAVALTLDSPPAGITGTFAPASATGDNSTLTIAVASTVSTGNYTLTVKGSAAGPGDKTTSVALTVTPEPNFTLSFSRLAMTINAGSGDTGTVTITRTNYTGPVDLALNNPPAGVAATFAPASPTGNTSVMTLNVATTVVPGNYSITVRGSAAGVPIVGGSDADQTAQSTAANRDVIVALTVMPVPDFALSASPNALNISVGGSGATAINIARTNMPDPVTFALESPPAGFTGVFTPPSATGGTTSLQLNLAGSVTPGNYTVTVKGTSGALSKTTTVAVTVVAGPNVGFSLTPATLSVAAGGASGNTTLNINRTNYTLAVTPQASGQPVGMTIGFTPTSSTGNSLTITVTAGAGVTPGNYNVTISAPAAPGSPSTVLQVTVTAPVGTGAEWQFCAGDLVPTWFGFRNGNGSVTQVLPTVAAGVTKFTFTLTASTGAVIIVTHPSEYVVEEFRFSAAEAAQFGLDNCTVATPTTFPVNFTWTGATALEGLRIAFKGTAGQRTFAQPSGALQATAGISDAWSARYTLATGVNTFSQLDRNIAVPNVGGVTINSAAMLPMGSVAATLTNVPVGSTIFDFTSLTTNNGPVGSISNFLIPSGSTNRTINFHPTSQPTDMYQYFFTASGTSGPVTGQVTEGLYLGPTPTAQSIAAPSLVPSFTNTTTSSPGGLLVTTAGVFASDYLGGSLMVLHADQIATDNTYMIVATPSWLSANGMTNSYSMAMSDLSGAGFPAAARLMGPIDQTTVSMSQSNVTGAPTIGSFFKSGSRSVSNP